ncbi:MAG: hypothetical protein WCF23_08680 [Candidatus Nitrosopolaris sp.]
MNNIKRKDEKIKSARTEKSPRKSSLHKLSPPTNEEVEQIIRRDGFLYFQIEEK